MEENGDLTYWNIPVSRLLNKALEEAIKLAGYRTRQSSSGTPSVEG